LPQGGKPHEILYKIVFPKAVCPGVRWRREMFALILSGHNAFRFGSLADKLLRPKATFV